MLSKTLPLLLALFGLVGGIGAGLSLRPTSEGAKQEVNDIDGETREVHADASVGASDEHAQGSTEYVKMNNQFVVPVVQNGRVASMVVLSLSLEVTAGNTEAVYQREPKLRDVFLRVMFDHANIGGFSGSFTDGANLVVLRSSLKEAAALVLGTVVKDVLITDIARQDG